MKLHTLIGQLAPLYAVGIGTTSHCLQPASICVIESLGISLPI